MAFPKGSPEEENRREMASHAGIDPDIYPFAGFAIFPDSQPLVVLDVRQHPTGRLATSLHEAFEDPNVPRNMFTPRTKEVKSLSKL